MCVINVVVVVGRTEEKEVMIRQWRRYDESVKTSKVVFFFFKRDIEKIYLSLGAQHQSKQKTFPTKVVVLSSYNRTSFLLSSCLCSTVTHVPAAVSCRNTSMATPDPPATRTLMLSGSKSDRIIIVLEKEDLL